MNETLKKLIRQRLTVLAAGAVAVVLLSLGCLVWPETVARAYLPAALFWLGVPLGAMALWMVHGLSGGRWGEVLRPALTAATATLPLMLLLFVPLLFVLPALFEWTGPSESLTEVVQNKLDYLNIPFFTARAAVSGGLWLLLALGLLMAGRWRAPLSAFGLMLHVLLVSFFAFDWIMSLEPQWYSSTFGLLVGIGQAVAGLSVVVAVTASATRVEAARLNELGNLLLATVLLWIYLAFMQYLIIWSANLPHGISWYVHRNHGVWGWIAVLVVAGHFAAPFGVLLFRAAKQAPRSLTAVALGLALAHQLYLCWQVLPAWEKTGVLTYWLAPLAILGVGCLWLGAFAVALARQPVTEVAHG